MIYLWIIPTVFYVLLIIPAIVIVIQEDILYSKKEKVYRILFIIFIPFLGAILELKKLSSYIKQKEKMHKEDVNENARVYKFFEEYTPVVPISSNDSAL